jgi:hypothetical protein
MLRGEPLLLKRQPLELPGKAQFLGHAGALLIEQVTGANDSGSRNLPPKWVIFLSASKLARESTWPAIQIELSESKPCCNLQVCREVTIL